MTLERILSLARIKEYQAFYKNDMLLKEIPDVIDIIIDSWLVFERL